MEGAGGRGGLFARRRRETADGKEAAELALARRLPVCTQHTTDIFAGYGEDGEAAAMGRTGGAAECQAGGVAGAHMSPQCMQTTDTKLAALMFYCTSPHRFPKG